MEISFKGKTVLVTGASEGIGFETARLFGQCGANVAICARHADKLEKAKAELEALGIHVLTGSVDVKEEDQFRAFADETEKYFGTIDVLVNNAGWMPYATIEEMPMDQWDGVVATNLTSVFLGLKIGLEKMKAHGGVIINASSFTNIIPTVGYAAYSCTKAAIASLTRTAASEFAPYGIRVVGYIPGFIDTPMTRPSQAVNGDKLLEPIPLRRLGRPEEIARGIVFAASDWASYISGTNLEITGGKFSTQAPGAAWKIAEEEK